MNSKQLSINIISSILQIVIVGVCLFFFYRLATQELGKETFGLWSLVLSISSLANLGNLGISGGLVKFVAEFNSQKDYLKIRNAINISSIVILVVISILATIIFFASNFLLSKVLEPINIKKAQSLIPYTLFTLGLNAVSSVFSSSIEGMNRAYSKNILNIFVTIAFFITAILLIKSHGIMGIAYAQLFQSFLFLGGNILLCYFYIPQYSIFKLTYDKSITKSILGYGLKLQGIAITSLSYEPIIKGLLSKYGGLDFVTYYEISIKVIFQVRSIIMVSMGNLIPKIAVLKYNNEVGTSKKIYLMSIRFTIIFSFLFLGGLGGLSPLISSFFLGEINIDFIITFFFILVTIIINSIIIPAYMFGSAESKLNLLFFGHLIIGVLIPILGYTFAQIFNNYIIIGWMIAYCTGSVYILQGYHREIKLSTIDFFKEFNLIQVLLCLALNFGLFYGLYTKNLDYWLKHYFISSLLIFSYLFINLYLLYQNKIFINDLQLIAKSTFKNKEN